MMLSHPSVAQYPVNTDCLILGGEQCWDAGREMKQTTFTQSDSRTILGNTTDKIKIIGRRREQR